MTGELWVADVGFTQREEINLVTPGFNGGWPYYESNLDKQLETVGFGQPISDPDGAGPLPQHDAPPDFADTDAPVYSYAHPTDNDRTTTADNPTMINDPDSFDPWYRRGAAVMGGVVYRGPDPTLQGKFIFYESGQRKVLKLDPNLDPSHANYVTDISDTFFNYNQVTLSDSDNAGPFNYPAEEPFIPGGEVVGLVVSLTEDPEGNIFLVSHFSSNIFKLATSNPSPASIQPGMPGTRGDFNSDGLLTITRHRLIVHGVAPRSQSAFAGL